MRLGVAFLVLLTTGTASAQPLSVRPITLKWKKTTTPDARSAWLQKRWAEGRMVMPYVSGGPPGVAARINESLFLQLLDAAAPLAPADTFTPAAPPALDRVGFQVRRNDDRIIAVEVHASGCGASCSESQVEYHFDARTGRELTIDELFTPRGQATLARRRLDERLASYKAEVRRLTAELRSLGRTKERKGIAQLEKAIETNRWCVDRTLEERENSAESSASHDDGLYDDELHLADDKTVSFQMDAACSGVTSHDPSISMGSIALRMTGDELAGLLSPYGKAVLLGQGHAPPPRNPFGQILFGTIGGKPVTLRLTLNSDASISGIYFYDQYRRTIALSGRRTDSEVTLVEKLAGGAEATFELSEQGGRLFGTWSSQEEQLPVVLHL